MKKILPILITIIFASCSVSRYSDDSYNTDSYYQTYFNTMQYYDYYYYNPNYRNIYYNRSPYAIRYMPSYTRVNNNGRHVIGIPGGRGNYKTVKISRNNTIIKQPVRNNTTSVRRNNTAPVINSNSKRKSN